MSVMTETKNFKFLIKEENENNYNLLEGLMPDHLKIIDVRAAMDTEDVLIIIDSLLWSTNINKDVVKERIKNNKPTKILIDYAYETGLAEEDFDKKIVSVCKMGIPASDIIWVLNRSANNAWMQKHSNQICLIDLFAISAAVRHTIHGQPSSVVSVKDRPNKINFIVGNVNKPSRKQIIQSFYESELKDKSMFSFLGSIKTDNKKLKKFVDNNQGPLDGAETFSQGDVISSQGWSNNSDVYDNSSVSFICETHDTNDSFFLTEKTYRTILNRHPFVLRAAFPALRYLNKLGFKTFDSLIDESYDNLNDITKEYSDTLVSTCGKLLENIKGNEEQVEQIVNHNYNTLIELAKLDLARLNAAIFSKIT